MPNGNQLARFTYNQRLELVKSTRARGCGPVETHRYEYDLNHNWTKKDGVDHTNNIADQLLAVAGGGSLSYNGAGQATNVQGWDVTYNCSDQITGIQMPGKNIAYRYDGAGQRVEKTVNGLTQKFLWNGGDICKEYRADGSVRADYFLGAGREGIKTDGEWYFYLSDIQGSTLMLTDSSGHSAATYDFSDYGETRQTSGSTSLYNPFLYTGQEYDFETSLYHLRARHYSPEAGRFLARDPIGYGAGSNLYSYCAGDPIGCSDPTGLERFSIGYFQGQLAKYNTSRAFSGNAMKTYFNRLEYTDQFPTGFFSEKTRNISLNENLSGEYGQTIVFFHELLHAVLFKERGSHLPAELQKIGTRRGLAQVVIDHAWIYVQQGLLMEDVTAQSLGFNDEAATGGGPKALQKYRDGGWCGVLDYVKGLRQTL
jgi:RHS repeat-associated protein